MVTLISLKQVRTVIEGLPLAAWARDGTIPVAETTQRARYYLEYFQRLSVIARGHRPSRIQAIGCTLEWYAGLNYDGVDEKLAELRAAGKLYVSAEVSLMMGYDSSTVVGWVEKGFLSSIVIRRRHFFFAEEVVALKKAMDAYTSYEAAEKLGCALGTVNRLARQGKLKAVVTPDGWRFDVDDVNGYSVGSVSQRAASLEGWTATSEICHLLDVNPSTLNHWMERGVFSVSKINGFRYVPTDEVLRIKTEREVLRGGFDAMQRVLSKSESSYTSKEVASRLGISARHTLVWTTEGLLPYYDLSSQTARHYQWRTYVAWYVDSFVAYAKKCEQKPSKVLARTFKLWAIEYYAD